MTDETPQSNTPASDAAKIRSLGQAVRLNNREAAEEMLARLDEMGKMPEPFDFHAMAMRLLIDHDEPDMQLLDILVKNGANLMAKMPAEMKSREDSNTPIYPIFAILSAGREKTVLELVRSGRISPEYSDGGGVRLLMRALAEDRLEFSDELLGLGADIDGVDIGTSTALHSAVARQDVLVIDWLLSRGASLTKENMARALPAECVPEGEFGDGLFEALEALREARKTDTLAQVEWPENIATIINSENEMLEKIRNPSKEDSDASMLGLGM